MAQARVQLPLGRNAAERWAQWCLEEVVRGPSVASSLGLTASKRSWPFAKELLVSVTLRPTRPPSEEATEAIVSAEVVGYQLFDWGASGRVVKKLCAALAEPVDLETSPPVRKSL